MMKSVRFVLLVASVILVLMAGKLTAHCEIPCGIYDDPVRITLMKEHITTIEKSMAQIVELSAQTPINYNQIVRWVTNKEEHATKFMEIVTQYFMTQRIKPIEPSDPAYGKYQKELSFLHEMLVYAMKCKQTTDTAHVVKLRGLVDSFAQEYFEQK